MNVSSWPQYLLKRIPLELREALSEEARERDYSLADLIREILCSHYGLECPRRRNPKRSEPIGYGGHGGVDNGATTMRIVVQPELWTEMVAEMQGSGRTMRSLVLEILEAHYERQAA